MRTAAVLAITATLVAAPAAAGAAPVCRLVVDDAGDHALPAPGTPANDQLGGDLDIRSADVAANDRHVVAAVRLASFQRVDPRSPGRHYAVLFTVGGVRYTLAAVVTAHASKATLASDHSPVEHDADVSVDPATAEIRISASARHLGAPPVSRGRVFERIEVHAAAYAGVVAPDLAAGPVSLRLGALGTGTDSDVASTTRTYRGGTATCVPMPR